MAYGDCLYQMSRSKVALDKLLCIWHNTCYAAFSGAVESKPVQRKRPVCGKSGRKFFCSGGNVQLCMYPSCDPAAHEASFLPVLCALRMKVSFCSELSEDSMGMRGGQGPHAVMAGNPVIPEPVWVPLYGHGHRQPAFIQTMEGEHSAFDATDMTLTPELR